MPSNAGYTVSMLTKDDISQIGIELGKVIEQNITPVLDEMRSQMVTRSYLDDKLAELEGTATVRQRKEDQKLNLLIDLLHRKALLQDNEVAELQEIQVFPRL